MKNIHMQQSTVLARVATVTAVVVRVLAEKTPPRDDKRHLRTRRPLINLGVAARENPSAQLPLNKSKFQRGGGGFGGAGRS